ncbi:MAG TPA: copper-translocating P-type ATPase [Candidatus Paceibacterota bacterium]
MDPEVVAKKPGKCPKCGMNLAPMGDAEHDEFHSAKASRDAHGGHHAGMEEQFRRRFFAAVPLTLIVLALSPKIQEWFGFEIAFSGINLVLFGLASVIALWAGWPFYQMAKAELQNKAPAMMTLVSFAVLAGYLFSVSATFLFEGESLYWEVSTLVLAFLFGHWMEMRAIRGASGALAELAKLIPPTAHKLVQGEPQDVSTQELSVGDVVLVRPGEKVPIDGVVKEGESSVNESMVTGESKPVAKKAGSEVIGGTINNDGSLTVEVSKTGEETAISQIMELIRQAQETKPPVQELADRAASWLFYIAVIVGSGTFLFWLFVMPQGAIPAIFAGSLAISVVVIACPHALGLAIPTVTTITSSLAAKNGILIRDMKAAEIARKLTYVVFDKTGTLTKGQHEVAGEVSEQVLQLAASLESFSEHPIARAIVRKAKENNIQLLRVEDFARIPGKGVRGKVEGKEVQVLQAGKERGVYTIVEVSRDNEKLGAINLGDAIRPESFEAIKSLKDMGIKVAMITGDAENVAKSVAKELGIDTYFARVLPEDKVNKIKELQQKGEIVAMVGDGVNDAASLTQAHVGIAIGAGTDVAIESAEIVLVKDNPSDVVKAIRLSQKTNSKMKQNLAWAAGYNIVAIPMAAGILFPFGILLRPEWAALLMSASSVIVVANALLLRKTRL